MVGTALTAILSSGEKSVLRLVTQAAQSSHCAGTWRLPHEELLCSSKKEGVRGTARLPCPHSTGGSESGLTEEVTPGTDELELGKRSTVWATEDGGQVMAALSPDAQSDIMQQEPSHVAF